MGYPLSAVFSPKETKGYGAGRKGVYVSAPGPHPEKEDGFVTVWLAISLFFFWAFGTAGQPSNMVRLMAFMNAMRRTMLLGCPAVPNAQKKNRLIASQTVTKPSSFSGCGPGALT